MPADGGYTESLTANIFHTFNLKYSMDVDKSFLHFPGCNFGKHGSSIEMNFTYTRNDLFQNQATATTCPPINPIITVSLRRTFLKLEKVPEYKMRKFHPKSGFNQITYKNESEPLLKSRGNNFITRHHLIKKIKNGMSEDSLNSKDTGYNVFNDRGEGITVATQKGFEHNLEVESIEQMNSDNLIKRDMKSRSDSLDSISARTDKGARTDKNFVGTTSVSSSSSKSCSGSSGCSKESHFRVSILSHQNTKHYDNVKTEMNNKYNNNNDINK